MKKLKFPSEVTVASLEVPYIFQFPSGKDFDTEPKGSEGKLLVLLSEALNFKYKLVTSPDRQWGSYLSNGTWTGLVGMVGKGDADMALCTLSISDNRHEMVDFSKPYSSEERTFATNFPRPLPRVYTYTYSFDMKIWCGIFVTILLVSFLFRLFKLAKFNYMFTFLSVLGNLCSRSIDEREFKRSVLLVFWWTFSFVVSSSYAAVLAALLALPVLENSPKNINELAQFLREKRYKIVSVKESSFVGDMLKSPKENVAYIAEMMVKNDWFVPLQKRYSENSIEDNTALLGIKSYFNFRYGKAPLATKFISDDAIETTYTSLILNKLFCCKQDLDIAVGRIVEGGLYQQITAFGKYKAWVRASNSSMNHNENLAFVMNDVLGPFIVLLFGNCFSTIVFLIEIIFYHLFDLNTRL